MASIRSATEFDVYIGEKIRGFRNQLKISQEALGAQLGVSFQQVQKYEKGTNRLSGERLQQLAQIFDCEVADLLPEQRGMKKKELTNLDRIVATRDGMKLVDSFVGIKSAAVRTAVIALVKRLERL